MGLLNNGPSHTHHGGLDGAMVGAVAGHESRNGHTARDAAIGALGGHAAESHHERHMHGGTAHPVGAGAGVAPVGAAGTTHTTTTTTHHEGLGSKIKNAI